MKSLKKVLLACAITAGTVLGVSTTASAEGERIILVSHAPDSDSLYGEFFVKCVFNPFVFLRLRKNPGEPSTAGACRATALYSVDLGSEP